MSGKAFIEESTANFLRSRLQGIQTVIEETTNRLEALTCEEFEDLRIEDLRGVYNTIPALVKEYDRIIELLETTRKDYT